MIIFYSKIRETEMSLYQLTKFRGVRDGVFVQLTNENNYSWFVERIRQHISNGEIKLVQDDINILLYETSNARKILYILLEFKIYDFFIKHKYNIIMEKQYYDVFLYFARTNDIKYLNYLITNKIFRQYPLSEFIPTMEECEIIFYYDRTINMDRLIKLKCALMSQCDLFDQFCKYGPTPENISVLLKSPYRITNIDIFRKIVYEYPDTFKLIVNYSLNVNVQHTEDYVNLLSVIECGNKISLIDLNDEYLLAHWYELKLDDYFFANLNRPSVLCKRPDVLFNSCLQIIQFSKYNHCFSTYKYTLAKIFKLMSNDHKNIFRDIIEKSDISLSYKKYLINRTYCR